MPQQRLLVCFAHPDDEAFPVGGALAAHTARGVTVRLVTTTSGEEGEIRQPGVATRETLGAVRRSELACSVQTLGIAEHLVLDYRDSGMAGWPSNDYPEAFINAPAERVVEQLVEQMRLFRPHVVLTFETGGLYGHPDHIAICKHTTEAFRLASDPSAFPHQLANGLEPHAPQRLFYSARPKGFRTQWAQKLRDAGVDTPLPSPDRADEGTPPEEIHLEMDVADQLEVKKACIKCHWTQVAEDWPYDRVPREVAAFVLGREFYIQAYPELEPGQKMPPDFFHDLPGD
jgi:LmbE family N-acetylglucosaminyl deacetylase